VRICTEPPPSNSKHTHSKPAVVAGSPMVGARVQKALDPGVEAVRIAETGQLTPGDHQRLLHGILGPSDVSEDPLGDRHEPVAVRSGQDGECLPVAALGLLHEIALQPIVLLASHADARQGDAFRLY